MPSPSQSSLLDLLVEPLSRCLTPESAKRLVDLRATARLQAQVDRLGEKSNEGTLSADEEAQYAAYISFGTFVAVLKSKARKMLATETGK